MIVILTAIHNRIFYHPSHIQENHIVAFPPLSPSLVLLSTLPGLKISLC